MFERPKSNLERRWVRWSLIFGGVVVAVVVTTGYAFVRRFPFLADGEQRQGPRPMFKEEWRQVNDMAKAWVNNGGDYIAADGTIVEVDAGYNVIVVFRGRTQGSVEPSLFRTTSKRAIFRASFVTSHSVDDVPEATIEVRRKKKGSLVVVDGERFVVLKEFATPDGTAQRFTETLKYWGPGEPSWSKVLFDLTGVDVLASELGQVP